MIIPELLELVKSFQTMIVGAVGFLGVIWTMRANARIARAEHQRQLETKRATLRRILAAEFRNYSHALRGNLKASTPEGELFSVGRVTRIFSESLATDLGLLELDEIDIVVNALISMEGLNHFLENHSLEHSETRFLVPVAAWEEYREAASKTANALELGTQAIELIEGGHDVAIKG